ncbi:MAG: L,D-transpeptidase [Proteobacteria bacterium]|nr:L,D-transpeptidase [Pseudomonadota bacterium]
MVATGLRVFATLLLPLMFAACAGNLRATLGSNDSPALPAELADESVALLLDKSSRQLSVYREGELYRRYPVNLGRRPSGAKRFQGDMRTPEGLYRISSIKPHNRWVYFLAIDYPNRSDNERYKRLLEEERVPILGGKALAIGSGLGLHGSDSAHDGDTDWTRGCVALSNSDITELHELVETGTPVLFRR